MHREDGLNATNRRPAAAPARGAHARTALDTARRDRAADPADRPHTCMIMLPGASRPREAGRAGKSVQLRTVNSLNGVMPYCLLMIAVDDTTIDRHTESREGPVRRVTREVIGVDSKKLMLFAVRLRQLQPLRSLRW